MVGPWDDTDPEFAPTSLRDDGERRFEQGAAARREGHRVPAAHFSEEMESGTPRLKTAIGVGSYSLRDAAMLCISRTRSCVAGLPATGTRRGRRALFRAGGPWRGS